MGAEGADRFDIERFRRSTQMASIRVKKSVCSSPRGKAKSGGLFLYRVPVEWLATAHRLGGKTGAVGEVLWLVAGLEGKNPVKPRSSFLTLYGVKRCDLPRALVKLEQADLVSVERRVGKRPLVTIAGCTTTGTWDQRWRAPTAEQVERTAKVLRRRRA